MAPGTPQRHHLDDRSLPKEIDKGGQTCSGLALLNLTPQTLTWKVCMSAIRLTRPRHAVVASMSRSHTFESDALDFDCKNPDVRYQICETETCLTFETSERVSVSHF